MISIDIHSYPVGNVCLFIHWIKQISTHLLPSLCLRGKETVIHSCRLLVTPEKPSHHVYISQPSHYFTKRLLAFAQWASWAPRKSFILSQLCLPRQMFYIKNTKSCPEVLASKNSQVALASGRWCNVLWTCVLQSPPKGKRQHELTGRWGGGIGWVIPSLMMCGYSM